MSPSETAGDWRCLPWWSAPCSRPCRRSGSRPVPTGAWLGASRGAQTAVGADSVHRASPSDQGNAQWRHLGVRARSQSKRWSTGQLINEEAMRELEFHHFTNPYWSNRASQWPSVLHKKGDSCMLCISWWEAHTLPSYMHTPNIKPESNQVSRYCYQDTRNIADKDPDCHRAAISKNQHVGYSLGQMT